MGRWGFSLICSIDHSVWLASQFGLIPERTSPCSSGYPSYYLRAKIETCATTPDSADLQRRTQLINKVTYSAWNTMLFQNKRWVSLRQISQETLPPPFGTTPRVPVTTVNKERSRQTANLSSSLQSLNNTSHGDPVNANYLDSP